MSEILLLLEHRGNRRLLAEALSPRHNVILPESDAALDGSFDLGIVDGVSLDRLWDHIQARKQAEQPAFLPFLLVTARQDVGMATRHLWKSVDELIITPIEKIELQARVASLLELRRLSLEFERALVYASPLAVIALNQDGLITEWNPAAERIFGWSEREVLGQSLPFLAEEQRDEFRQLFEYVWRGGVVTNVERRRRKKDGSIIDVAISAAPLRDTNGVVTQVVAFVSDISERKRAEQSLRESEERFRRLMDNVPDIIYRYRFSPNRGYEYVSPAATQFLGYTPEEYYADPDLEMKLVHPDDKSLMEKYFQNQDVSREPVVLRLIHKNGSIVWVELRNVPICDDQGNLIAIEGIARNITERRKAEEALRLKEKQLIQAQKLESLGTLASGIAHDFNNILAIIMGHGSLLERVQQDPEKLSIAIDAINKASARGAELVKQLLTFARKSETIFTPVSVNDVVHEIVKLMQATFPKTVEITFELQKDLPVITADATQIHQVLLNLCVNARDAMPKGGTLSISTRTIEGQSLKKKHPKAASEQYVEIRISDTGTGMSEETLQRIFEPFFTTKDVGKGTGLGLALVYGIVENHNGLVDVESKLGHGTTFRVYLPAHLQKHDSTQPKEKDFEAIPGGSETILLVEDEEMLRSLLTSALLLKGYTVLTAQDGEEGLQLYRAHQAEIAVVITDRGLPKMTGEDLFKRLRQINPKVNVIMASGVIEPHVKSELFDAGMKDFLQKPYDVNEVLQSVRNAIDSPSR